MKGKNIVEEAEKKAERKRATQIKQWRSGQETVKRRRYC